MHDVHGCLIAGAKVFTTPEWRSVEGFDGLLIGDAGRALGVTTSAMTTCTQSERLSREYETICEGTALQVYIHALDHGVRWEIHESPILHSTAASRIRKAMALTVEPGLHHHGLGGSHIEDVAHVFPCGREWISKVPYKREIP